MKRNRKLRSIDTMLLIERTINHIHVSKFEKSCLSRYVSLRRGEGFSWGGPWQGDRMERIFTTLYGNIKVVIISNTPVYSDGENYRIETGVAVYLSAPCKEGYLHAPNEEVNEGVVVKHWKFPTEQGDIDNVYRAIEECFDYLSEYAHLLTG